MPKNKVLNSEVYIILSCAPLIWIFYICIYSIDSLYNHGLFHINIFFQLNLLTEILGLLLWLSKYKLKTKTSINQKLLRNETKKNVICKRVQIFYFGTHMTLRVHTIGSCKLQNLEPYFQALSWLPIQARKAKNIKKYNLSPL